MLVTDLIHWKNHHHNAKRDQHNDSVTNISNRSPSQIHQRNDATNITVTIFYNEKNHKKTTELVTTITEPVFGPFPNYTRKSSYYRL